MPPAVVQGGATSREVFAFSRGRLRRTIDGGCTWSTGYSVDPVDAATNGSDQLRVLAQAEGYQIVSMSVEGRQGYALLTKLGFTGLVTNLGGLDAFVIARSSDAGATWTTDLLRAPLPNVPAATPVLGSGLAGWEMVVASPADPRVAYVVVDSRDPRELAAADASRAGRSFPAVYVTRDGGATWTFWLAMPSGTPQTSQRLVTVRPDPVDPGTLYVANGRLLEVVTGVAAPVRVTVMTLPDTNSSSGLDILRRRGTPATLLVTAQQVKNSLLPSDLFLSRDGGRTWRVISVPTLAAGDLANMLEGGGAWLTAGGDIVAAGNNVVSVAQMVLQRWSAKTSTWQRMVVAQAAPTPAGASTVYLDGFGPGDTSHRTFLFGARAGTGAALSGYAQIVGSYDTAVR
jgi:hypothetical protein